MRRVFNGQTTQVIVDAQITTGQWQMIDSYVRVDETPTVTLSRFIVGKGWVSYKEFITAKVPANDEQFFWIDTTLYK